jgi:hypothetical protein
MAGHRIDRSELAARVIDTIRTVAAGQVIAMTCQPLSIPVAEQSARDTATAFVALAGLLYPQPDTAAPSGEGWAFIDGLIAASREGAHHAQQQLAA